MLYVRIVILYLQFLETIKTQILEIRSKSIITSWSLPHVKRYSLPRYDLEVSEATQLRQHAYYISSVPMDRSVFKTPAHRLQIERSLHLFLICAIPANTNPQLKRSHEGRSLMLRMFRTPDTYRNHFRLRETNSARENPIPLPYRFHWQGSSCTPQSSRLPSPPWEGIVPQSNHDRSRR